MKTCCQCGAHDRLLPDGTHYVRPEIHFLKDVEQITARQQRHGWFPRAIFQGRQCIERNICTDCLNSNYIRAQLNSEQQSKANALERQQTGEQNFYLMLADVDGAY